MRDRFKFRAKRLDNNKFVYGYLCFIYIDNEKHCKIYSLDDAMSYDCYTETLGQCTGLKDKNGKLIYEGDIILKSDVSAIGYSRTRVCKVHRHNDWLSWAITTQYGDTYELSEFEPQQYEIIGNIHKNADLIKVGEK